MAIGLRSGHGCSSNDEYRLMSIQQGTAFQFLNDQGILGIHNVSSDSLKFAMYTTLANISLATVDLQAAIGNELVGAAYPAGGVALTQNVIYTPGGVNRPGIDFADLLFSNATWGLTAGTAAQGAVIYNNSAGAQLNKVMWVMNFAAPVVVDGGDLTVSFPDPTNPAQAMIRITG